MAPSGPRWYYLGPWILTESDEGPCFSPPLRTVGLVDLRGSEGGVGFFATDAPIEDSGYEFLGTSLDTENDGSLWRSLTGASVPDGARSILDNLWLALTECADPDGAETAPPIMPTHKGLLELHLGGHSLVKSRRFQGESDPAWPRIQARLQRNYREIRKESLRSKEDKEAYLRVLGAWKTKYRVREEILIPADLPREQARRPTTVYRDDFNRADGALGEATWGGVSQGWSWQNGGGGGWTLVSNRAQQSSSSWHAARVGSDLSSDDQRVTGIIYATSRLSGPVVRFNPAAFISGTDSRWYAGQTRVDSVRITRKAETGTFDAVLLASQEVSLVEGDPYSSDLSADGSTITYTSAGVTLTVTDTHTTGYLRTGIYGIHATSYFDDFQAEDLLAGPAFNPAWAADLNRHVGFFS